MEYRIIEFDDDDEEDNDNSEMTTLGVALKDERELTMHGLWGTPHSADTLVREDHPTWELKEIAWDGIFGRPVLIYNVPVDTDENNEE